MTTLARKLELLSRAEGERESVSVADALEFRREQYGLTRTEFATILSMQRSHYNEVLNGKRALPLNAIRRAFALGVPAKVLLQPERVR